MKRILWGLTILLSCYFTLVVGVPSHISGFDQQVNGTDPDFPGFEGTSELLRSCSYLIPMDTTYQGCGDANDTEIGIIPSACDACPKWAKGTDLSFEYCTTSNTDFNLFAYGLVNELLWNDIPVLWIIKTNKSHDEYDVENLNTSLIYPLRLVSNNSITQARARAQPRSFRSGPFAIETIFTSFADPFIINYTETIGEVRVYLTTQDVRVDVRYRLLQRPFVAVLASSGQQNILIATLLSAGFQNNTHFEVMTKDEAKTRLGQGVCITMAMEPHFHSSADTDPLANYTNSSSTFVSAARTFLNYGSNFFVMCGGINTYEQCDNENGVYCNKCNEYFSGGRSRLQCGYCFNETVPCTYPYTTKENCTSKNVGMIPFGGTRGGVAWTSAFGNAYGRRFPITPGYCKDGFFMTENVNDSSWGGIRTPPRLDPLPNNVSRIHNMNPDIPFNQFEGGWEYEGSSTVPYMSLWHPVADNVTASEATTLRAENWAHWTVGEETLARDMITGGYPYGYYYAAHGKLKQFIGQTGGNVFYLAGHYYSVFNKFTTAGYYLPTTFSKKGETCVDSGPVPVVVNATYTAPPANSLGGGCFNKVGRRLFMNAVLTPSNLTCNRAITICSSDGCKPVNKTITFDPCATWGVCNPSAYKKRAVTVTSSAQACSQPLRCSCDLVLDCCGVCGGNGESCGAGESPSAFPSHPAATNVQPMVINGQVVKGLVGDLPPVVYPPTPNVSLTPLSLADIIGVLSVSRFSLWREQINGVAVTTLTTVTPKVGPIILSLSSVPSDITGAEQAIKLKVLSIGVIDPSRVTVVIDPNTLQAIITVDNHELPTPSPQPSTAQVPVSSDVNNITGTTKGQSGSIPAGQCLYYTYQAGTNAYKVNHFAAILTPITNQNNLKIRVYINKNTLPQMLQDYQCISDWIMDNNEYIITWEKESEGRGGLVGKSFSLSEKIICSNNTLPGDWFVAVCAGDQSILANFQVSVLYLPSTPPTPPFTESYGVQLVYSVATLFLCLCSIRFFGY